MKSTLIFIQVHEIRVQTSYFYSPGNSSLYYMSESYVFIYLVLHLVITS